MTGRANDMSPLSARRRANVDAFIESTHGDRATQRSRSIPGTPSNPRSKLLMRCMPSRCGTAT